MPVKKTNILTTAVGVKKRNAFFDKLGKNKVDKTDSKLFPEYKNSKVPTAEEVKKRTVPDKPKISDPSIIRFTPGITIPKQKK